MNSSNIYSYNIDIYANTILLSSFPIFIIFEELSLTSISQYMIMDLLEHDSRNSNLDRFYAKLKQVITDMGIPTKIFPINSVDLTIYVNLSNQCDISHIINETYNQTELYKLAQEELKNMFKTKSIKNKYITHL